MKRNWRPIVAMAVMVAVLAVPVMASANNSWSKYHWDISTEDSTNTPLKFGDNLSTQWKSSLEGASTDWNQSVLTNEVVSGTSTADCDPTLGQVEVCNSTYGDNGWLGIAQVWIYRGRSGHIAQGLVKANDWYFNTPQYNTQSWRDYVICQEVGHTLGLDHQDEKFSNDNLGTCMDYTSDPDAPDGRKGPKNNLHPNLHDYDVLFDKYGHLNGIDDGGKPKNGNGGGKGKPAGVGPKVDLNNPSAWGKAIKQDAQGNNSLFERDLGNGQVLLTYVIWVK